MSAPREFSYHCGPAGDLAPVERYDGGSRSVTVRETHFSVAPAYMYDEPRQCGEHVGGEYAPVPM